MARMYNKAESKRRILSVCVQLFIEKGFTETTNAEILKLAGVSNGTFYNIFKSKDGVLMDLAEFMFSNQFSIAEKLTGDNADPVLLYAVETSIQMTITELNENLRDIYVEAYTNPEISDYIYRMTASELHRIFGVYQPEYTEADFFELEIGSAGIMRSYMARKCDCYFTLNKKLERFLSMSLRAYSVPEDKQREVISKVMQMDIVSVSNLVMQNLFEAMEMKYDFSLSGSKGRR